MITRVKSLYSLDVKPSDEKPIEIKQLFLYPVRGIRGIEVESLELTPLGPKGDRNWVMIDAKTLRFVVNKNSERLTYLR